MSKPKSKVPPKSRRNKMVDTAEALMLIVTAISTIYKIARDIKKEWKRKTKGTKP